jgi:hypothetical membrane protein
MAATTSTDFLLKCGILAGPVYVVVGLLQVLLREGFDIRRHALSLMSNGSLGWIQIATFIVSGALVIAGAVGVRQRLLPGRGSTSAPILLAIYGLGLIGAGLFIADPMDGFPPGTPPGPPAAMSWHGPLHFMAGGIGFIGLVGATFVFARRFAGLREYGWATFSLATGVLFLAGFGNIASGSRAPWVNLAFTAVVVLSWAWLSAVCAKLMTPRPGAIQRG